MTTRFKIAPVAGGMNDPLNYVVFALPEFLTNWMEVGADDEYYYSCEPRKVFESKHLARTWIDKRLRFEEAKRKHYEQGEEYYP